MVQLLTLLIDGPGNKINVSNINWTPHWPISKCRKKLFLSLRTGLYWLTYEAIECGFDFRDAHRCLSGLDPNKDAETLFLWVTIGLDELASEMKIMSKQSKKNYQNTPVNLLSSSFERIKQKKIKQK